MRDFYVLVFYERKEGTEAKCLEKSRCVRTVGEPKRSATFSSCPFLVFESLLKGGKITGIAPEAITLHVQTMMSLGWLKEDHEWASTTHKAESEERHSSNGYLLQ